MGLADNKTIKVRAIKTFRKYGISSRGPLRYYRCVSVLLIRTWID